MHKIICIFNYSYLYIIYLYICYICKYGIHNIHTCSLFNYFSIQGYLGSCRIFVTLCLPSSFGTSFRYLRECSCIHPVSASHFFLHTILLLATPPFSPSQLSFHLTSVCQNSWYKYLQNLVCLRFFDGTDMQMTPPLRQKVKKN